MYRAYGIRNCVIRELWHGNLIDGFDLGLHTGRGGSAVDVVPDPCCRQHKATS